MALKEKSKTNNKVEKDKKTNQITYSDGGYTIHVPADIMKKVQERIDKINQENLSKSK